METLPSPHDIAEHPIILQLGIQLPPAVAPRYRPAQQRQLYVRVEDHESTQNAYLKAIQTLLERITYTETQLSEGDTKIEQLESNLTRIQNDTSCDMVFAVGEDKVPAHSTIVSNWSAPMENMLQSMMREGLTKEIRIHTEELATVQAMVKYFYTAETEISAGNALPLLRLSSLYDIASLRDKCLQFLQNNIDAANCLQLFLLCELHAMENLDSWKELRYAIEEFVKEEHYLVLTTSDSIFRDMGQDEVYQLLVMLDQNVPKDSKGLYYAAFLEWAKAEWKIKDFAECIVYLDSLPDRQIGLPIGQIFIKGDNHTFLTTVTTEMTVLELKREIARTISIPVEYQKLLYCGRIMHDFGTMAESGIGRESTVRLLVRPNATGSIPPSEARELPASRKIFLDLCIDAIVADFTVQCNTQGFLQLNSENLIKILRRDDVDVAHEIVVLHAISQATSRRADIVPGLLPHIRFPFMELETLLSIPYKYPTIGSCSTFKALLEEAMLLQTPQLNMQENEEQDGATNERATKRVRYNAIPKTDPSFYTSFVVRNVLRNAQNASSNIVSNS